MKKLIFFLVAFFMVTTNITASDKITLKEVTGGEFSANE